MAWLELQKRKYQERGLTAEISTVKKKQRALLVRLEKERAALAKLVSELVLILGLLLIIFFPLIRSAKKQQNLPNKAVSTIKINHLKMHSFRRSPRMLDSPAPQTALKAIEISAGSNLEE